MCLIIIKAVGCNLFQVIVMGIILSLHCSVPTTSGTVTWNSQLSFTITVSKTLRKNETAFYHQKYTGKKKKLAILLSLKINIFV